MLICQCVVSAVAGFNLVTLHQDFVGVIRSDLTDSCLVT